MPPVLSVRNISKTYRDKQAVKNVSFEVSEHEIVGLLGPNGAGKTTIINMVLGVLEPTAGSVLIESIDIASRRSEALARTNFAAAYAQLPANLTAQQNLHIFGMLYSVPYLRERIAQNMRAFDLEGFAHTKCGLLSSGEGTRLALAKAMLNEPRLLLLDEPTVSLDPSNARRIRELIRAYASEQGCGVLWTSHNMYEITEVCDRVLFLSRGELLLGGNPKTLPGEYGKETLEELFITIAREPLSLELL
jgi:ABC-2 type transport system ATP-binding protein